MKRAALVVAASAVLFSAPTGAAIPVVRDGKVNQAVADTLLQALMRRGFTQGSEAVANTNLKVGEYLAGVFSSDACAANLRAAGSAPNWGVLVKCLGGTYPLDVGADGEPFSGDRGDFGGGGATGSWGKEGDTTDCGDFDFNLDAQGNLIVPSFALNTGKQMALGTSTEQSGNNLFKFVNSNFYTGNSGTQYSQVQGKEVESMALRLMHLYNMRRLPQNWYGVIGYGSGATAGCIRFANVAHRTATGTLVTRHQDVICGSTGYNKQNTVTASDTVQHKTCPEGTQSPDFHFYGEGQDTHLHQCIHYYPNPEIDGTPKGYAINRATTVPYSEMPSWPEGLPEHLRRCGLSADFVRAIADKLLKEAASKPGYNGAPYQPVEKADARPGDAKVEDLKDDPSTTGTAPNPQPEPDPTAPAPTNPGGTTTTGYRDECDFGAGGCDNPNTPAAEVGEAPTGIMDPIFDWLPDLPSITLNTQNLQCPVWAFNLQGFFGGSQGQYLLESHCELMDDPDLTAALSALMLALYGIMAAMIILRA